VYFAIDGAAWRPQWVVQTLDGQRCGQGVVVPTKCKSLLRDLAGVSIQNNLIRGGLRLEGKPPVRSDVAEGLGGALAP
jgi:hypothetical protein